MGIHFRWQQEEIEQGCHSCRVGAENESRQEIGEEQWFGKARSEEGGEEGCCEADGKKRFQEKSMIPQPLHWCAAILLIVSNACIGQESLPKWETAPPEAPRMQSLFDGASLSGWDGDSRLWSVRDGAIRGETTSGASAEGNTFLIWKGGVVRDFELRLSFRCSATNNSGVQYRSQHIQDGSERNAWVVRGYQHEIRNELQLPNVAGFIYDEGGQRGRVCLVGEQATWNEDGKNVTKVLLDQENFHSLFRLDDWNDVVIIARGTRIKHYLNGKLLVDFTDLDPKRARLEGVVALQLHAGKPMWVEFRDIRLSELE